MTSNSLQILFVLWEKEKTLFSPYAVVKIVMQSQSLIDIDKDAGNYSEDLENWTMMKTLRLCLRQQGRRNRVSMS